MKGDLVDALLDCHGRIRAILALAVALGERTDVGLPEVVDASARVERYFEDAFPLHVEDEDVTILPFLRGRSSPLDAALQRMHEQHVVHGGMIRDLCAHARALRVGPREQAARDLLAAVARPVKRLLEHHLEAEEKIIFPAIRAYLSPAEQQFIRSEMDWRRRT